MRFDAVTQGMDNIVSTLGAGSGIDTKLLIDQLVAAERTGKTAPLNNKAAALDARISALGQVRSALQGIAQSLDARVRSGALGLLPTSSDSTAVIIERFGTGPTGAFVNAVTVNRLASAQQLRSPPLAAGDAAVGLGTITFAFGTRTDLGGGDFGFTGGSAPSVDIVIDASNNSLVGLRDAINRSSMPVTASIISTAGSATLSLRGADGSAQAFIISAAPAPGDTGLARFGYTPGSRSMTLASAAGNSELSVDGIAVTRSSNVIDDLLTGTRLTLKKADGAATTQISAARDGAQLSTTISDFASTLGAMRALVGDFRKGATGSDVAGALANDATARAIDQRIAGLVTAPVAAANSLKLRDLGVSIARDGAVSFDAARFAALSPTRYGDAEALLKALAAPALSTQPSRLQSIADLVTPASAGLTRQRSAVTTGLATVDIRLATYRSTLARQYAAMDRLVAASNAVKAQLDQQIAAWSKRDS
ncbi:MAG: flagellar filament capping protein FliD [Polymorphobacter sp.]